MSETKLCPILSLAGLIMSTFNPLGSPADYFCEKEKCEFWSTHCRRVGFEFHEKQGCAFRLMAEKE